MLLQFSSVAEACENSEVLILAIRPSEAFVTPRWQQLVDCIRDDDLIRKIVDTTVALNFSNVGTICVRSYDREIPVILTYGGSLTPVQALSINALLTGERRRVPLGFLQSLDRACETPDTQRGSIYFSGYGLRQLSWLSGTPSLLCAHDRWRIPLKWCGDIIADPFGSDYNEM